MIPTRISRSGVVAAGALTATVLTTSAAQAHGGQSGADQCNPGTQRMHELHVQGNPGVQRMHEQHVQDHQGMHSMEIPVRGR